MFLLLLYDSGVARSLPLACSYAPFYFSSYEVFEQHFIVPSLVSCDCIAKIPASAERTVLGFHGASGAPGALLYVVVWRSDGEVAVLAVAYYVPDSVVGSVKRSGVVPTAKQAVKGVLIIGEKVGSAGFGRADFGRSADFLGCVPCQGYECHGYDHGPNWYLYVIALTVAWETASQPALVAFANAPHHCV